MVMTMALARILFISMRDSTCRRPTFCPAAKPASNRSFAQRLVIAVTVPSSGILVILRLSEVRIVRILPARRRRIFAVAFAVVALLARVLAGNHGLAILEPKFVHQS